MTEAAEKRVAGFLGLCTRAGQLSFGQEACVDAARTRKAALVLLDEGSSENTRKRFLDSCKTHGVPLYGLSEGTLAQAVGKEGRKVAAVMPGGMAQKLLELLKDEPTLPEQGTQG